MTILSQRSSNVPGFNLLSNASLRRYGDRSQAIDDQLYLLRGHTPLNRFLYFLYRSKSSQILVKCTLQTAVSELLDYIADNFCILSDKEQSSAISDSKYRSQIKERLVVLSISTPMI